LNIPAYRYSGWRRTSSCKCTHALCIGYNQKLYNDCEFHSLFSGASLARIISAVTLYGHLTRRSRTLLKRTIGCTRKCRLSPKCHEEKPIICCTNNYCVNGEISASSCDSAFIIYDTDVLHIYSRRSRMRRSFLPVISRRENLALVGPDEENFAIF